MTVNPDSRPMTQDRDTLYALDLSLMLARDDFEHRPTCGATRRDQRGYVVATCSFHPGHENLHRDVHAGRTWA